jgi:hypothetical protein
MVHELFGARDKSAWLDVAEKGGFYVGFELGVAVGTDDKNKLNYQP